MYLNTNTRASSIVLNPRPLTASRLKLLQKPLFHRVVIAIRYPAHAPLDIVIAGQLLNLITGAQNAAVAVVQQALAGVTLAHAKTSAIAGKTLGRFMTLLL